LVCVPRAEIAAEFLSAHFQKTILKIFQNPRTISYLTKSSNAFILFQLIRHESKLHAQEHAQFSLINALTFMHVKNVVKSIVNHTNVKIIEL
jgi:hypothetical protein